MLASLPTASIDLFDEAGITQPYELYRTIRDLGPAVALSGTQLVAVARYDDVRAVLSNHDTFVSGQGVLLSDLANQLTQGTTLASDPPLHDQLRAVVAHRLTPRALRGERASVEEKARAVVERAVRMGDVDGVIDIAQQMPMAVVPDFLGFPQDCRDRLLDWAKAAIEAGGPPSDRTPAAGALAMELGQYASTLVAERRLPEGSLGADLLAAADRGEISVEQCPALLMDYFGPSLETTVSALGSALALFAQHPDQWEALRRNPGLVGAAFNEVLRLESPLRGFTRVAAVDTEIGGAPIPAGTRLLVLYASANRDERKWVDPDVFDVARDSTDHLALGYGVHGCAGQGLARLEVTAVLTELASRVRRLELLAEPSPLINSMVRAQASLPLRLHP